LFVLEVQEGERMIPSEITEIYFKGTNAAIDKIVRWWKEESGLELGRDIQIVDLRPQLKEE